MPNFHPYLDGLTIIVFAVILFGAFRIQFCHKMQKGDGNDGEPGTLEKLEMEKKAKKLVGIKKMWMVRELFEKYSIRPPK